MIPTKIHAAATTYAFTLDGDHYKLFADLPDGRCVGCACQTIEAVGDAIAQVEAQIRDKLARAH